MPDLRFRSLLRPIALLSFEPTLGGARQYEWHKHPPHAHVWHTAKPSRASPCHVSIGTHFQSSFARVRCFSLLVPHRMGKGYEHLSDKVLMDEQEAV